MKWRWRTGPLTEQDVILTCNCSKVSCWPRNYPFGNTHRKDSGVTVPNSFQNLFLVCKMYLFIWCPWVLKYVFLKASQVFLHSSLCPPCAPPSSCGLCATNLLPHTHPPPAPTLVFIIDSKSLPRCLQISATSSVCMLRRRDNTFLEV